MTFTEQEQRTIMAVFDSLTRMPYNKLNRFLGSVTIKEMQELYRKMYYAPYCERLGISYEDLTEDDEEALYREIWEA